MKVSATRIKTGKLCKRRYAFRYLHGASDPVAESAEAGTRTHELLELGTYNGDEVWQGYPIGEMARRLGKATSDNVVSREESFEVELHGITFVGKIDFQTDNTVGDYKTTSRRKRIRSAESLEDDEQRLLYSRATGKSDCLWLYGVWEDLSVHPVYVPGNDKRDRQKFRLHVLEPAQELLALPADVDPLALEANTFACGLYPPKGCPYLTKCYDRNGQLISHSSPYEHTNVVFVESIHRRASAQPEPSNNQNKCIGTLYIDAFPIVCDEPVTVAAELIARAAREVCKDADVKHSQLVEYGKGQHMLAAQLTHDMQSSGMRYEHVYLETRSAEGRACMFELQALAERVVRGMVA